ncbi:GTP-binding protein 10, partial [Fragariocoptes setiger]
MSHCSKLTALRRVSQAADLVKLKVSGGAGGHGLPQYGGIGGKGGDVYVQGDSRLMTLRQVVKSGTEFKASVGSCSKRTRLVGDPGDDVIVKCPIGVTVIDDTGTRLGDINSPNDKVLVALGGRGGSKENDMHGVKGQRRVINLDFKVIADVGFVGFPNAGKSTLLKAISRAKPKIASYPFTTIRPNLGQIQYPDYRSISVADLPGLIEGAHKNLGLGHNFLKHTTHSRLLAFIVDVHGCLDAISILMNEIRLFDELILQKPTMAVLTKMDLRHSDQKAKKFFSRYSDQFERIVPVSGETGQNIEQLKIAFREMIDTHAEAKLHQEHE